MYPFYVLYRILQIWLISFKTVTLDSLNILAYDESQILLKKYVDITFTILVVLMSLHDIAYKLSRRQIVYRAQKRTEGKKMSKEKKQAYKLHTEHPYLP